VGFGEGKKDIERSLLKKFLGFKSILFGLSGYQEGYRIKRKCRTDKRIRSNSYILDLGKYQGS